MENFKQKILIVDDERLNIEVLMEILKSDYRIITAKSGKQALEKIKNDKIDLVLLDIMMPDISGYEVCREIKRYPATSNIPIIFITALKDEMNEYEGLDLGAIDYITKPINSSIVKARVKNHLKLKSAMQKMEILNKIALDANPNTGLPGNNSIIKNIQSAISARKESTVVYADLDHFKAYNDRYSFAKGDEVIIFSAALFQGILHSRIPESDYFLGHVGGDDFVIIIPSSEAKSLCREITDVFDREIRHFYSEDDLNRGYFIAKNRKGAEQKFEIMTISLGCVDLSNNKFKTYVEVIDACSESKAMAKQKSGSSIFFERRTPEEKELA